MKYATSVIAGPQPTVCQSTTVRSRREPVRPNSMLSSR